MEKVTTTEAPGAYDALRNAIAARYPELSKQLQKIARFALEYPDDLALETVASLAARAGVQPSSMVRFAQALGYDGFSNMQLVFRSRLVADGTSYRDRIDALRRQHDAGGGDALNVLSSFVDEGITSLELLRDHTPATVLEQAVDLLPLPAMLEEVREELASGSLVVDARSPDLFAEGHIKGTGLGLSITKDYVMAHGGIIKVGNRQEGRGAHLSLRMPIGLVREAS